MATQQGKRQSTEAALAQDLKEEKRTQRHRSGDSDGKDTADRGYLLGHVVDR